MNSIGDILDNKSEDLGVPIAHTPPPDEPVPTPKPGDSTPLDTQQLQTMIRGMKDQLDAMLRLLQGNKNISTQARSPESTVLETGERIVEGVFTGERMVGQDGKEYPVAPNYASKSKLVEGDIMKLTITNKGSFVYKQIQQVDKKRVFGELVGTENGYWTVLSEGKSYKVLTASVTFYKGKAGDEVFMLVPSDGDGTWGAVENIISK